MKYKVDTDIDPMNRHPDAATIEIVERYGRTEEEHPNKNVDNWKGQNRLKKRPY